MREHDDDIGGTASSTTEQASTESDLSVGSVRTILEEECNGKPHQLLRNNDVKYALARWKANPLEYDFAYDEVSDAINWHGVNMAKGDFRDVLDQIWREMSATSGAANTDGNAVPDMTAQEFYANVDLNSKRDREIAYAAFQWLSANLNVLAIEEEGEKGDLLHFDGGIWKPGGLKHMNRGLNMILKEHSTRHISNEVEKQYFKVEQRTNISTDELGLDGRKVAVANGLLDLRAGEIERSLKPDDYAITMIPHEFDPDATCLRWEEFISETVEPEKQDLIQEYVGYTLLRGEYPYAKALMLLGEGRNGKTTFLNTIEKLLGPEENVMNADLSELSESRFSAYRLEGKLANINADIENDKIQNISMFKNSTGGDWFEVEQKYGDPYDFRNSAKMIFASNHLPAVDTDEYAFFRRWLLVRFPHKFTMNENDGNPSADPDLSSKLDDEMEGILAWAVRGIQRLLRNDGQFTSALTGDEVRDQWHSYSNPLDEFVREWLIQTTSEAPTRTSEIYDKYMEYMQEKPSSPVTQAQLTRYIKNEFKNEGEYGTKKDENRNSYRGFGSVHIHPDRR